MVEAEFSSLLRDNSGKGGSGGNFGKGRGVGSDTDSICVRVAYCGHGEVLCIAVER